MGAVQARNTLDAKGAATPSDQHTHGTSTVPPIWVGGHVAPAPVPVPRETAAQPCGTDLLVDSPSRSHAHRLENASDASCCTVRGWGLLLRGVWCGLVLGLEVSSSYKRCSCPRRHQPIVDTPVYDVGSGDSDDGFSCLTRTHTKARWSTVQLRILEPCTRFHTRNPPSTAEVGPYYGKPQAGRARYRVPSETGT